MAKAKVVIKKYSDRRLYDTSASRYVKLEDIAHMIREGVEVEIRDSRTGKDLTAMVLTQIVMEDVRDGETALPLHLLREMVIASNRATRELLSDARQAVSSPVEFVRNLLGGETEVERLRHRVEELEARLAEYEQRARRTRRKTRA